MPSKAAWDKLVENSSKVGVLDLPLDEVDPIPAPTVAGPPIPGDTLPVSLSILKTLLLILPTSTLRLSRTLAATPSPSRISPNNKCSVPI